MIWAGSIKKSVQTGQYVARLAKVRQVGSSCYKTEDLFVNQQVSRVLMYLGGTRGFFFFFKLCKKK